MINLIEDIQVAWISHQGQTIDLLADIGDSSFHPSQISLTFPYNPVRAEELNCLVLGIGYEIIPDYPLKICFATKVLGSPFTINNYTRLPYCIDRGINSRPILVFTSDQQEVEIVSDPLSPLKRRQVRFIDDYQVECSPDLIGEVVNISCSILIKRWIQEQRKIRVSSLCCNLASQDYLQVIEAKLLVQPQVNLQSSRRVIVLSPKDVKELSELPDN